MKVEKRLSNAQRAYAQSRKDHRPADIDESLMKVLAYNVVSSDITLASEKQLLVLFQTIRKCPEILEICLNISDSNTMYRKLARMSLKTPFVFTSLMNKHMCKSISVLLSHSVCRISKLELVGVKLDEAACLALSKGLEHAGSLHFVSFKDSKMGDSSFAALSHGISKSKSIQELDISNCCLSDAGGSSICSMLRAHTKHRNNLKWGDTLRNTEDEESPLIELEGLLTLNASYNQLGNRFGEGLSMELAADEWIGAINLSGNQIDTGGSQRLFRTLIESNVDIVILDLRDGPNSAIDIVDQIDETLRLRSTSPSGGLLKRSGRESCRIISNCIVRWECGHQVSSAMAGVVACFSSEPEINMLGSDILINREDEMFEIPAEVKSDLAWEAASESIEMLQKKKSKKKTRKKSKKKKKSTASTSAQMLNQLSAVFLEQLNVAMEDYKIEGDKSFEDATGEVLENISGAVAERLAEMWQDNPQ